MIIFIVIDSLACSHLYYYLTSIIDIYEGELKNWKKWGKGIIKFSKGDILGGEWEND